MKKTLSVFVLALGMNVAAYAQVSVQNAHYALKEGKLIEAKEFIDKASDDPKANVKEKTWRYRGDIYIALSKSTDAEVLALDEDYIAKALEAYNKAIELDKKGRQKKGITKKILGLKNEQHNKGVEFFNNKDYKNAFTQFKNAATIGQSLGIVDSSLLYNAAIAAKNSKDYENAAIYFEKCATIGYDVPSSYHQQIEVLNQLGDKETILAALQAARVKFPSDQFLLIQELNIYLKDGNDAKAEELLNKAISNDPNNENLFNAIGNVMEKLKKFDKAKEAYAKAIELKPDFFEPLYSLGAMYFNKGVNTLTEANNALDNNVYEKLKKEANADFSEALPFLEKARELKSSDRNTLNALKQLYVRLNFTDKFKEVNEALKNL